jgi:hypothetical protein
MQSPIWLFECGESLVVCQSLQPLIHKTAMGFQSQRLIWHRNHHSFRNGEDCGGRSTTVPCEMVDGAPHTEAAIWYLFIRIQTILPVFVSRSGLQQRAIMSHRRVIVFYLNDMITVRQSGSLQWIVALPSVDRLSNGRGSKSIQFTTWIESFSLWGFR